MSSFTRPSVVSSPARETTRSSEPVKFVVPAKTRSSGPFSAGCDSPVIDFSSSAERPARIVPSAGTKSPGRTRTTSPGRRLVASTSVSVPSMLRRRARVGVMRTSDSIAARAPRAVRRSTSSPSVAKKATAPAVT